MSTRKKKRPAGSFEASVKRLEEIVEQLEEGNVDLESSIALYEEGIQLSRACAETLKEAELRIRKLSKERPVAPADED